ncbi:TPA: hypothetical protein ACPFI9_003979 [Providencia rettgeri]
MISLDSYNEKISVSSVKQSDVISLEERIFSLSSLAKSNDYAIDNHNASENEFINSILNLPTLNSPREYSDEISKLLYNIEDSSTGDKAFKTFDSQKNALQRVLESVDDKSMVGEGVMAVLLGVVNAESQMTKWMQDIILSGGAIEEYNDW